MQAPTYEFAINRGKLNVKLGAYLRLSKDDGEVGESGSIENQRKIIKDFAKENGYQIVEEYADDGWSGTNFDRPAFQRMLSDIKSKKINCVVTKDLSRLGRNYVLTGYYIETFFPENNVRYIAINDRVDTDEGDSDLAPFMNVFNEFHAKQTSKKIRSVFASKFKDGECHYNAPPMGYIKDPSKKNHLIPDPETGWVVKKMFELAGTGKGPFAIRTWLFENKIITPGYRAYIMLGRYKKTYDGAPESRKYEWDVQAVKRILENPLYVGTLVHYKKRTPSFKNKKIIVLPADKHLVIEGAHEPIITKELFDIVQKKINTRKRSSKNQRQPHIFAGITVCGTCGYGMRYLCNHPKSENPVEYLYCGRRSQVGTKACKSHYVRYDILCEAILDRIQLLYRSIEIDKDAIVRRLSSISEAENRREARASANETEQLMERKNEILNILSKLYEDSITGKISESIFDMMSQKYKAEYDAVCTKLAASKQIVTDGGADVPNPARLIEIVERMSYPTKLTSELVNLLIDKIVIHDSDDKPYARGRSRKIDIHWKFTAPENKESIFK